MKQPAELGGHVLLHGRQGVRVNVKRDLDPLMPEPFGHHFDRDAGLKQEGGAGVAEPMERDRFDVRRLDQPGEFPFPEIVHGQRLSEDSSEDQPMVLVGRSQLKPQRGLGGLVPAEQFDRPLIQVDRARLPVLGWSKEWQQRRFVFHLDQLSGNRDRLLLDVQIGPLQPAEFRFPRAAIQGC